MFFFVTHILAHLSQGIPTFVNWTQMDFQIPAMHFTSIQKICTHRTGVLAWRMKDKWHIDEWLEGGCFYCVCVCVCLCVQKTSFHVRLIGARPRVQEYIHMGAKLDIFSIGWFNHYVAHKIWVISHEPPRWWSVAFLDVEIYREDERNMCEEACGGPNHRMFGN